MRDALICLSDYSRDGRGVLVRGAGNLSGQPGPVFCRYEQLLLVNGPMPGKVYPDVVGWIAEEDLPDLLSHGEFRKVLVEEISEGGAPKPEVPPRTILPKFPPILKAETPQEE